MLTALIRCLKSLCWLDRHQLGAEGSLGLILGAAELSASADSPLGLVYLVVLAFFLVNLWTVNDTCLSSPISVCSFCFSYLARLYPADFPCSFPTASSAAEGKGVQLGGAGPVPGMQWGCHLFCGAGRAFWMMGMATASVSAGVCASTRIMQQGLSFIFRQLIRALPFILKHQSNRHPKISFTWLFDSKFRWLLVSQVLVRLYCSSLKEFPPG